jgi:hypothetical protein
MNNTASANGDSLHAEVGASGQRCFKVGCAEPVFVVYRKIYDGSPVLSACKQHQDILSTKLKWQLPVSQPPTSPSEVGGRGKRVICAAAIPGDCSNDEASHAGKKVSD